MNEKKRQQVREFLDTALHYADSIAIAVGSPPPPSLAAAAPGGSDQQVTPDHVDSQELSLLQLVSGAAREAEQGAPSRERGEGVIGGDGQEGGGVAGVGAVSVIEVSPWGKFTPALNALLGFAARDGAELVMFQARIRMCPRVVIGCSKT